MPTDTFVARVSSGERSEIVRAGRRTAIELGEATDNELLKHLRLPAGPQKRKGPVTLFGAQ
ncbi:hypothetical protein PPGU19_098320 (plasmid) [Paraburkholderia sp. PGU19]|uniref:hypothetical protein n=1 Tax=Paraburkholderia sp. PGU19 TaxID=2735434 RepID=UPI0015DADBCE|nr:hypothetical protein [Paraburkholderia sp. PGU19]BCG05264.1 hypothetical protein PPGU19_098320 [Paraburkholderia sp. PGU19]